MAILEDKRLFGWIKGRRVAPSSQHSSTDTTAASMKSTDSDEPEKFDDAGEPEKSTEKLHDRETPSEPTPIPGASDESLVPDADVAEVEDQQQVLSGFKLVTVVASLLLAILCVALDNTSQSAYRAVLLYRTDAVYQ
jgi:hypothetical protein